MRIPVRTENGWQIDAILDTTYVATKDGESVTLEADTLEQMELLIALREGNAKEDYRFCPNCGAEMRKDEDDE